MEKLLNKHSGYLGVLYGLTALIAGIEAVIKYIALVMAVAQGGNFVWLAAVLVGVGIIGPVLAIVPFVVWGFVLTVISLPPYALVRIVMRLWRKPAAA